MKRRNLPKWVERIEKKMKGTRYDAMLMLMLMR